MSASIEISTLVIAGIGGTAAALVAGAITSWNQHKQRQLELLKHQRELIFKTAFEHWKEYAKITAQTGNYIEPLDLSVIHMVALVEAAFGKELNVRNLKERLEQSSAIINAAQDYYLSIKQPVRAATAR